MPYSGQYRSDRVSQRKHNQAFTMIELLVVIGILVVLMGIALVAFHGVSGGAKKRQTETIMHDLKGMLAELEAANGLKSQPSVWLWWNNGVRNAPVDAADAGYSVGFWKTPYHVGNSAASGATWDALTAPGDVSDSETSKNTRNGSIAVVNTSLAMAQLAAVAANKTAIQRMAQNSVYLPRWSSGTLPAPTSGSNGFLGYQTTGNANVSYCTGVHVTFQNRMFVGTPTLTYTANPQPNAGANSSAPWYDESAAPLGAPLMLDGWGNPIIFVPGSGLKVRLLNGKSKLDPNDATQNFIVVSSEGKVTGNFTANPVVDTPGRPFWASAGPDGDFSKGDDNVYSFGE